MPLDSGLSAQSALQNRTTRAYFFEKVAFGTGLESFSLLRYQPKISVRVSAKIVFCFSQRASQPLRYSEMLLPVPIWTKNAAFDFPTFSINGGNPTFAASAKGVVQITEADLGIYWNSSTGKKP